MRKETIEKRVEEALHKACRNPLTDYGNDQPYVTSAMVRVHAKGELTTSQITSALKRLWAKGKAVHYSQWSWYHRWYAEPRGKGEP